MSSGVIDLDQINGKLAVVIGNLEDRLGALSKTLADTTQRIQEVNLSFTDKFAEQSGRILDRLSERYKNLLAVGQHQAAAPPKGAFETIKKVAGGSILLEDRIKQLSIAHGWYEKPGVEEAFTAKVRAAAVNSGMNHDDVASGAGQLVDKGMDPEKAGNYAGIIAKTAISQRTDAGSVADLIHSLQTDFKLNTEAEMLAAIDVLAKAGKQKGLRFQEMSKMLPELGVAATAFGSTGVQGVQDVGAFMQTMQVGAGDAGEAKGYVRSWFEHINASSTQARFKNVGIDFEQAKLEKIATGKGQVSNIEAGFMVFGDYIDKIAEASKFKNGANLEANLAAALEQGKRVGLQGTALEQHMRSAVQQAGVASALPDMQATQAYLAWTTNKGQFHENRQALGSATGTVDKDWAEQSRLTTVQWERLKTSVTELGINIATAVLPAVNSFLGGLIGVVNWANQFPNVTGWVGAAVVGLTLFGTAAVWIGGKIKSIGENLDALRSFGRSGSKPGGGASGGSGKGGSGSRGSGGSGKSGGAPRGSGKGGRALAYLLGGSGRSGEAGKGGFSSVLSKLGNVTKTAARFGSRLPRVGPLAMIGTVLGTLAMAGDAMASDSTGGAQKGVAEKSTAEKGSAIGDAVGGLAGGMAGGKLGAMIGTAILPGVGTVVGGLLGSVVGGIAGQWLGSKAGETVAGDGKPNGPTHLLTRVPAMAGAALPPPENSAAKPGMSLPPLPNHGAAATGVGNRTAPVEIKLDYNPQVAIHGDPTPQTLQKFGDMLRAHQHTLEQMLRRAMADQQRRAY